MKTGANSFLDGIYNMLSQKDKKEKFVKMFLNGLDDPIFEQMLRTLHLGESEEKFDEIVKNHRAEMEEGIAQFQITDQSRAVITPAEEEMIISLQNINGDNTTNTDSASDKGYSLVQPEHATDDGVSPKRGL